MYKHISLNTKNGNLAPLLLLILSALIGSAWGYLSPSIVVSDAAGSKLYIIESTAGRIDIFDTSTNTVESAITLPDNPSAAALTPDGNKLIVTAGDEDGKLIIVDLASKRVVRTIAVGHTPTAVSISPDGKTAYVCQCFNDSVVAVDLQNGNTIAEINVSRQPVSSQLSPDGKRLFVANLLPKGAADGDYAAAAVSVIDTVDKRVLKTIQLPNGSIILRDVTLSKDGKFAYVTHILARYQIPTTQLERGWINTNALSIIDAENLTLLNTVLLDDVDLGAANPWAVACSTDGKTLCVSHAGTDEISLIDRAAMHERLTLAASGKDVNGVSKSAEDVPNDLSFLMGIRKRIKLDGKGPRGIAIAGNTVYAAEYFSDSLAAVDLTSNHVNSIALGPKAPLTAIRRGQMLFNDATICFQQWQSCGSCHGDDGRVDGLNWDLLNDGIGNPKNTKSLLLSHQTPPVMALGVRDRAETAVRAGMKYIQFMQRPEQEAQAMDAYLTSLKPVPSPYLEDGQLSASALRGKYVFIEAGCADCHAGPLYTNGKSYNVGTGRNRHADDKFDTPTLIELWRTAPYLYDGRAQTLRDVLTTHNPTDRHGSTKDLSEKELSDLETFLLSL